MKRQDIIKLITTVILIVFFADSFECEARTRGYIKENKVGIVAHRGFWNCGEAGFAKNSVAALECAQKNHFWGSEFDVNMTSDGVLLVYHDSSIDGKLIEEYPYSEFKDITIANGETIPTIDDYLIQGKKYPKTMLVYEMKPHSCPEVEERFIELTIAKLKEHRLLNPKRVMFISFSYYICKRMAELLPGFTIQYLEGDKSPAELDQAGISGLDYHFNVFGRYPDLSSEARRLGMSTNAWTVNQAEDIQKVIDQGIMYITTDQPLHVRALIKNSSKKEVR